VPDELCVVVRTEFACGVLCEPLCALEWLGDGCEGLASLFWLPEWLCAMRNAALTRMQALPRIRFPIFSDVIAASSSDWFS